MIMTTERPPLNPAKERERRFYHYRKGKLIDVLIMSDALALWRIENWHQDLWPCEWGLRKH